MAYKRLSQNTHVPKMKHVPFPEKHVNTYVQRIGDTNKLTSKIGAIILHQIL